MALLREKTELQSQLDENEEDYNDVMKKYKAVVQQASLDQNMISQQSQQIEELSTDRERLKQEVRGTPGGYSIDWKYLTMNKGHTRVTPQIEKKGARLVDTRGTPREIRYMEIYYPCSKRHQGPPTDWKKGTEKMFPFCNEIFVVFDTFKIWKMFLIEGYEF